MVIFNIYLITSITALILNIIKSKDEQNKDIFQSIKEIDEILVKLENDGYVGIANVFRYVIEAAFNNNAMPAYILIFLISFTPILNICFIVIKFLPANAAHKSDIITEFEEIKLFNNENIITNDQLRRIFELAKIIKLPNKIYINESRVDIFKRISKIMFYFSEGWYTTNPFQIGVNIYRFKEDKFEVQVKIITMLLYKLKLYEGLNSEQAKKFTEEFINNLNTELSEIMDWEYIFCMNIKELITKKTT